MFGVLFVRACARHAFMEAVRTDVLCAGNVKGATKSRGSAVSRNMARTQRTVRAGLPSPEDARPFHPDVALCNYYTASGKMGLHQDKHESQASLEVRRASVAACSVACARCYVAWPQAPGRGCGMNRCQGVGGVEDDRWCADMSCATVRPSGRFACVVHLVWRHGHVCVLQEAAQRRHPCGAHCAARVW